MKDDCFIQKYISQGSKTLCKGVKVNSIDVYHYLQDGSPYDNKVMFSSTCSGDTWLTKDEFNEILTELNYIYSQMR
jgi:hypothetical protein